MLKILSVADVPPDPNAGASGTILFTNQALRSLGHDVTEIWSGDMGPRRIAHGNLHSLIEQPVMMLRAICRRLKQSEFDVVVSHQPQSCLAARAVRQLGWNGKFVVASQGIENRINPIISEWHKRLNVPKSRSRFSLFSPLLQAALSHQWPMVARWCDGFVISHREDREFVEDQYDIERSRIHLWDSGLPEAFLSAPRCPMTAERLNKLLYVGQFAFYKAPHLLAQIVNRVMSRNRDVTMTWICHRDHHDAARSLLGPDVKGRVTLSGWIRHEDLSHLFDTHGVLIFPTIAEGFGRVPLEAMSRGVCVVSSNCSGMRDYISHRIDGRLCPVGDVDAFCAEVEGLQRNLNEAEAISAGAYAKAQGFTWKRVAEDLGNFLTDLCEQRDPAPVFDVQCPTKATTLGCKRSDKRTGATRIPAGDCLS